MQILQDIQQATADAIKTLYGATIEANTVTVNVTSREFKGAYTVVLFPYVRIAKKAPHVMGEEIGAVLKEQMPTVADFNVIKGFLNLEFTADYWKQFLQDALANAAFGQLPATGEKYMVEYSSPNTNKPLHLGHIRNILLGWSSSRILEMAGHEVVRVQVINDRGIAICKSMYAWKHFAEGATPESTGKKSDHFVGEYYVLFEQKTKTEYAEWQKTEAAQAFFKEKAKEGQDAAAFFKAYKNTWFNTHSKLGEDVRAMLLQWEAGDADTVALWQQMNQWVYDGFDTTYDKLGVHFDKLYYESDTYKLGKNIVDEGLATGLFYKKEDGPTCIDLTDAGHDEKVVLRSDGTSLYMTQDLGTARKRYEDFACDGCVYVVADEQNYHFQVLFEILKRLGEPYAEKLHHLSYGLVELPTGRMKTREGTVVDADVLIAEVLAEAKAKAAERGIVEDLSAEEKEKAIFQIAMAALKFFILKVNPKKKMIFNPEESVELEGQTGPYIQYAYVRTKGVWNTATKDGVDLELAAAYAELEDVETAILVQLHEFQAVIQQAAKELDPSHIASYCYNLSKLYARFWSELSIFKAEDEAAKSFRLQFSKLTGTVLEKGMDLLGIQMPEKM